jgi:DUF3068 family protein
MRRLWGGVLLALGIFLFVLAGMLRFYAADRAVQTPIDQYAKTVAPGPGRYFDASTLKEVSADLTAIRTVKGDVRASTGDRGVWDVFVAVETGTGTLVRQYQDRVAFDRRTAESVSCCGEAVDGEPAKHTGVSYKFPFGTKKQDYQLWDTNAKNAYPAKFVSEEKVQGLTTYKFIEQVPSQQVRTVEVPGSLVGESATLFQAPAFYSNTRTVWVEPKSGVIVKGSESTNSTLRNSAGEDKITVLQADFTFDDQTQRNQAELARDAIGKINLISLWLPLGALVLGLILIAAGLLVLRAPKPRQDATVSEDEPEPALR